MKTVESFFKRELEISHLRGGIDQIAVLKKIIDDMPLELIPKNDLLSIVNEYEKLCLSSLENKLKNGGDENFGN